MKKLVCLFVLSSALPSWGMNKNTGESKPTARQYMLAHLQNIVEKHEQYASEKQSTRDNYIPCKIFAQELHGALSTQELNVTEKTTVIAHRFIADPTRINDLRQATLQLGCSVYITWQDLTKRIPADEVEQKIKDFHNRLASTIHLASDLKKAAGNDTTASALLNATILEAGQLHKIVCPHLCESSIPAIAAALPTLTSKPIKYVEITASAPQPKKTRANTLTEQEHIPASFSRMITQRTSFFILFMLLSTSALQLAGDIWNHTGERSTSALTNHNAYVLNNHLFTHSTQAAQQSRSPWRKK